MPVIIDKFHPRYLHHQIIGTIVSAILATPTAAVPSFLVALLLVVASAPATIRFVVHFGLLWTFGWRLMCMWFARLTRHTSNTGHNAVTGGSMVLWAWSLGLPHDAFGQSIAILQEWMARLDRADRTDWLTGLDRHNFIIWKE